MASRLTEISLDCHDADLLAAFWTAALDWVDACLPGEPVVLATQTANARSMRLAAKLGFTEVERFRAWGADQWLGQRPPRTPAAPQVP